MNDDKRDPPRCSAGAPRLVARRGRGRPGATGDRRSAGWPCPGRRRSPGPAGVSRAGANADIGPLGFSSRVQSPPPAEGPGTGPVTGRVYARHGRPFRWCPSRPGRAGHRPQAPSPVVRRHRRRRDPPLPSRRWRFRRSSPPTTAATARGTSRRASPPQTTSLAIELRALRNAERALRDGNPGLALAFLQELDRQVPNGQLTEERDAAVTLARCARGDRPFGVNLATSSPSATPGAFTARASTRPAQQRIRRRPETHRRGGQNDEERTNATYWWPCCAAPELRSPARTAGAVNIGNTTAVGSQLSDYAATWDGYAEATTFSDGSDHVRLTIDASGQGSLVVGDSAPLPAPTDPTVGYPPGAGNEFQTGSINPPFPWVPLPAPRGRGRFGSDPGGNRFERCLFGLVRHRAAGGSHDQPERGGWRLWLRPVVHEDRSPEPGRLLHALRSRWHDRNGGLRLAHALLAGAGVHLHRHGLQCDLDARRACRSPSTRASSTARWTAPAPR